MEPRDVFLRCGVVARILWDTETGNRPLIGAYYSEGEWLPVTWLYGGYHLDKDLESNLDIINYEAQEKL